MMASNSIILTKLISMLGYGANVSRLKVTNSTTSSANSSHNGPALQIGNELN